MDWYRQRNPWISS